MDSDFQRSYRKNLKSRGLIFLCGMERTFKIKNFSLTGLLADMDAECINVLEKKIILNSLNTSDTVDFFIPGMRMVGEAEVTRVDSKYDSLLLALKFKDISYEAQEILYRRKAYRKKVRGEGRVLLNGKYYPFTAVNISVDGILVYVNTYIDAEIGKATDFSFHTMGLYGSVKIIRLDHPTPNTTQIGLQFVQMERGSVDDLPHFSLEQLLRPE